MTGRFKQPRPNKHTRLKKPTPQQTYYSNASQIDTHIHAIELPNSKMSTIVQYNLTGGGFKSGSSPSVAFFLLCVKGAPSPQAGCLITRPSGSLQPCVHQDAAPQIVTRHTHLTIGNIT